MSNNFLWVIEKNQNHFLGNDKKKWHGHSTLNAEIECRSIVLNIFAQ